MTGIIQAKGPRPMSYSFNVQAATIALAAAAVGAKLDEVVAAEPVHAKDRDATLAAVEQVLAVVGDGDDDQSLSVNVNGSVSTWGDDVFHVGLNVNVTRANIKVD